MSATKWVLFFVCILYTSSTFPQLVACGAEALTRQMQEKANLNQWNYVREFKLHLYSNAALLLHGVPLKRALYLVIFSII